MRAIFYHIGDLTIQTALKFIEKGHSVIIIDPDQEKIESIGEELDCGFLVGEASHPSVLKEAKPSETDFFFSLSDNSQHNIVAGLIAQSVGVGRTVVLVDDAQYMEMCEELGLSEVVMASQITSQYLFDGIFNEHLLELFNFMKNKAFLTKIRATKKHYDLNSKIRIICYFRDGRLHHYDESVSFEEGDEVVFLTDRENMETLQQFIDEQS